MFVESYLSEHWLAFDWKSQFETHFDSIEICGKKKLFGTMKMVKWIYLGFCYSLLLISVIATTTESTRVIFHRTTQKEEIQTSLSNIVSVPMVRCPTGHHLDHRKKCRKIVNNWFRWRNKNPYQLKCMKCVKCVQN